MATFTVFAFGTGENSKQTQNIISQFAQACTSPHTLIEGPDLLGRQVRPNVRKATRQILAWLSQQDSIENTINLTGFSRGSVTCIHIANRLKRYERLLERYEERLSPEGEKLLRQLRALNMHIFAMDPVAGMWDKGDINARVIPNNVKSYVAVLQTDEMRRDFKPQDLTRAIISSPETTQVSMLPMFGNHSDTTKIKTAHMQSGASLTWYSLYQFLTDHGTALRDDKVPQMVANHVKGERIDLANNPNAKQLLQLYSLHHLEREHYLKSGLRMKLHDGIPAPRKQRSLNQHSKYYVKNADFFVNQMERELFKIAYPKAFNYLFEQNQFDLRFPNASASSQQDVIQELAVLKQEDPVLFKRLGARGVNEVHHRIQVERPRGHHYLEPCMSLQQIFPHLVPNAVKDLAPQMNRLALIEAEVYRFSFRYQREKSELNFHGHRDKIERAKDIRQEVNSIVNNLNVDRNTKYQMILDRMEAHYREMVQANSNSALKTMLQKFLSNHGRNYRIQEPAVPRVLLAGFVDISLSLIKESIGFAGNLGYVGGGVLHFVGTGLEDLGRRTNELLGHLGYNPLKYIVSAVAYVFEAVGYCIKNSFGLKPLTKALTSGIQYIKEAIVRAIRQDVVEPIDDIRVQLPHLAEPLLRNEHGVNPAQDFRERLHHQHEEFQQHPLRADLNHTDDRDSELSPTTV